MSESGSDNVHTILIQCLNVVEYELFLGEDVKNMAKSNSRTE